MFRIKFLFTLIAFLSFGKLFSQDKKLVNPVDTMSCQTALNSMFNAIETLHSAKFKLISTERIEGALITSATTGIIQYSPRKLFLRGFDNEGVLLHEILYLNGKNNNNALVSPNGFPYFNINLDPLGSTIRKDKHLTIIDAGGVYLVDMIKLVLELNSGNTNGFTISKKDGNSTILIIDNIDYAFTTYTVKPKDTFRSICYNLGVPEYKIIELNESIDSYSDLEEGSVIKVPNLYARKFELIIRNSDYIPLTVRIFDEQGLFSEYRYEYFEANPPINNQTFNRDNPAYTF